MENRRIVYFKYLNVDFNPDDDETEEISFTLGSFLVGLIQKNEYVVDTVCKKGISVMKDKKGVEELLYDRSTLFKFKGLDLKDATEKNHIHISQFLMGVAHDNQVYVKTYFSAMEEIMKSNNFKEEEKLLSNLLKIFNRTADVKDIKNTKIKKYRLQ